MEPFFCARKQASKTFHLHFNSYTHNTYSMCGSESVYVIYLYIFCVCQLRLALLWNWFMVKWIKWKRNIEILCILLRTNHILSIKYTQLRKKKKTKKMNWCHCCKFANMRSESERNKRMVRIVSTQPATRTDLIHQKEEKQHWLVVGWTWEILLTFCKTLYKLFNGLSTASHILIGNFIWATTTGFFCIIHVQISDIQYQLKLHNPSTSCVRTL